MYSSIEILFYFENCSDQMWEKIVLVIEKNICKFEAEGQKLATFLKSLVQFFEQWNVRSILETEYFFNFLREVPIMLEFQI